MSGDAERSGAARACWTATRWKASSPAPSTRHPSPGPRRKSARPSPRHYKVICISLYTGDLERLDALVDELKARGITKANRSALIRVALDSSICDKVPRGM